MSQPIYEFPAALDRDYLGQTYGEDWEYAFDMFETYVETLKEMMPNFEKSMEEKELSLWGRYIHKLRPGFKMVGYQKAFALADEIEERGFDNYEPGLRLEKASQLLSLMGESHPLMEAESKKLKALIS